MACSSVLLLFLLGGLVRVTGSGMGCPDWPRCFGLMAPPTCECQLPPDYQSVFLKKRLEKVQKFTALLDKAGLHKQAETLRTNKSILLPEAFNPVKAWIEYINRIFGVIAGLLALAFAIFAFASHQQIPTKIFALGGLFMLVLNAWLGSVVVATNLLPGIVSLHFMLSFLCVFFFMLAIHRAQNFTFGFGPKKTSLIWMVLFALVIIEVMIGALARENVEWLQSLDKLKAADGMMDYKAMKPIFTVHRLLPGVILVFCALSAFNFRIHSPGQARALAAVGLLSLIQIALGASNIVFVLPPITQVIHIVLGSILPVVCFYFLLAKGSHLKA